MSSQDVIDALFDRTVDIVQSLPKSGPIQTSYDEKLALYSLYKQAVEGDVNSKRPGMLDMLGRAKWDAWSLRKGMGEFEAKQLYVESMMRILRKFGDRREARQLIQELEAFSGDVAEQVMRGALATDDTASETSSAPAPLRHQQQQPARPPSQHDSEDDSEEEQDRLASLRNPQQPTSSIRRGPPTQATRGARSTASTAGPSPSVEAASTLAVGGARAGRVGQSSGSLTPQRQPIDSDGDSMSSGEERYQQQQQQQRLGASALNSRPTGGPAGQSAYGSSSRQPQGSQPHGRTGPPGRYGTGPPSSVGAGPSGRPGPPPRAGSAQGGYYAPGPPGGRFPPPPVSESNLGGNAGAGASLYSAIAPSRPIEHHYYHRPSDAGATGGGRAPSSIGAPPSVRGGPSSGPNATAAAAAAAAPIRPEVDQALQSIQASLAALHERLNRVESSGHANNAHSLYGAPLRGLRQALYHAFQDIGALFGLATRSTSRHRAIVAPSFGADPSVHHVKGDQAGGNGRDPNNNPKSRSRLSIFLRLLLSLVNLSLRITLDLTSLGILLTLLLYVIKRTTGRGGDPLVLWRFAQRLVSSKQRGVSPLALGGNGAGVLMGTTAAAAMTGAAAVKTGMGQVVDGLKGTGKGSGGSGPTSGRGGGGSSESIRGSGRGGEQ